MRKKEYKLYDLYKTGAEQIGLPAEMAHSLAMAVIQFNQEKRFHT